MIASKIPEVYDVELPASVKQLLRVFATGISVGVNSLASVLECLDSRGYIKVLALYAVFPAVLVAVIVVVVICLLACKQKLTWDALLQRALPLILKILFLSYPLVTNQAFEVFYYYKLDGERWLRADVTIKVGSDEHNTALILAWTTIVIYPIGLLVTAAALLYITHDAILKNKPTPLSQATAFLYQEFERQFFWWELIEMLRRFVLVGIMVLVEGMMQVIIGTLLAVMFLLFQVEASPYKDMGDDFLASSASFALVGTFICAYAFKDYEFVGLSDIQAKMSLEQRETYVVNQTILSVVMFATIILALLLAFCIFLVQFAVEGARLRNEARSARGRRLRYKTTQQVVQVPELPTERTTKKQFHIFLSHVRNCRRAAAYPCSRRLLPMRSVCGVPRVRSGVRARTRCAS